MPEIDSNNKNSYRPVSLVATFRFGQIGAACYTTAFLPSCSKLAPEQTGALFLPEPRRRPAKPTQAALIKVPRVVEHTPKGRAWRLPPPDDPEAKAKAVALPSSE